MFVLGVILLHKSNQCMLYLCCFVAGINKLAVIVERHRNKQHKT